MPSSIGKASWKLVLVIRREARIILGNTMLLHTTLVAVEEHIIHLFLVVCLKVFILSSKSCPEILQLLV